MSAISFTVYVSGLFNPLDGETQEELQHLADRITRLASKHQDFYVTRVGDVTVEPEED